MVDAAFLQTCADPGIGIEIVERFIAAADTENPLAISITSDNRILLPEPPRAQKRRPAWYSAIVLSIMLRGGKVVLTAAARRSPAP
jgi:hypothetical protein